jgi:hypothetical protein
MGRQIDGATFAQRLQTEFGAAPTPKQQAGLDAMFAHWASSALNDERWLAYALATAWHETGTRMEPVREGFCDTDDCSIRAVTRLFEKKKIKRNYALPHPNGKSYFGRGLVQITHGVNYERVGKAIGLGTRLFDDPALALDLPTSVKILFVGMTDGLFSGKRFADFFNNAKTDWVNARRIVNALDKADKIAGHAKKFAVCLA